MNKQFTCDVCYETFISDPNFTEEDRLRECASNFGWIPGPEERGSVCDDCYQDLMNKLEDMGAWDEE